MHALSILTIDVHMHTLTQPATFSYTCLSNVSGIIITIKPFYNMMQIGWLSLTCTCAMQFINCCCILNE